ncbi:Chitin synthase, class 5 [Didymella keratinophila]|nr:Chitin synthase, class 5 [Didymella keratinophila]
MLVSLTVGKVDAGVAVLLTEDKRLIEFPSILLPPDISSGSIVDIDVARNVKAENDAATAFYELQSEIFRTFGQSTPSAPALRCRNATQTSVVLEWDPIDVATAELRSLTLYRNGNKAGTIPNPKEVHSTKLSGLGVDTEYTFHLVLKTSAGTFSSEKLTVQTHKMTDLSGITITPGHMPSALRESLQRSVERIGAKIADTVRIDTTHFVCTEGRGPAWEKAVENNIPVVVPDWVIGCERDGRIVGVRGYYLNADPRLRQVGQAPAPQQPQPQPQQQQQPPQPAPQQAQQQPPQVRSPVLSPRTEVTPPTPEQSTRERESDSPAPPPPPKDDASERSASPALEQKTQAEHDEQKAKPEDLKLQAGKAPEEEVDTEDEEPPEGDVKRIEANLPSRPQPTVEDDEDGDDGASFQEVAL